MSFTYYNDYHDSDYWDPILYPKVDLLTPRLEYIKRCAEEKREIPTLEYFDIAKLLGEYNSFLEKYTQVLNNSMIEYDKLIKTFLDMKNNDPEVNKWLNEIKEKLQQIKIGTILFEPIIIPQTRLLICDKLFNIFKNISDDVSFRMNLLENIKNVFSYENPNDLFRYLLEQK